jgi:cobyrinic acid a,c-diamide synthase
MVGALPLELVLEKKPQGHGYTILEVTAPNPFYAPGTLLKGHEFHYSRALVTKEEEAHFVFNVNRGHGVDGMRDGLCKQNLLATYTHIHAAGNKEWAKRLLELATAFKRGQREKFHET